MSMKQLVEAECGGANPLVALSARVKAAKVPSASVSSSLSPTGSTGLPLSARSSTFKSEDLVRQMREARLSSPASASGAQVHPSLSDEAQWNKASLEARSGFASESWSKEFSQNGSSGASAASSGPLVHPISRAPVLSDGGGAAAAAAFVPRSAMLASQLPTPLLQITSLSSGGARWAQDYLPAEASALPLVRENEAKDAEPVSVAEQIFGIGASSSSAERWAEEFADLTDADIEELARVAGGYESAAPPAATYKQDFWKSLEEEWEELSSGEDPPSWLSVDESNLDRVSQYEFSEDNPLLDHPDALSEGKRRLREGDVPSAVLLFEAACQQNQDSAEAWALLGTSQAKNEQDPRAIAALRRALSLDPDGGGGGDLDRGTVLMALATSYANESFQAVACTTLQDWIRARPEYASSLPDKSSARPPMTSTFMSSELHAETTDIFLKAVRLSSGVDPDVQCGLGILYNLSEEYDKAVDCFQSALSVRPDDALLWNKLGATLANGNRSEEAVNAYHRALHNSPGFVRSRYNLGISCINLKAYEEACQHFLTALNFQSAGRGPKNASATGPNRAMSDSIWSSLRLSLSLMGKRNLLPEVEARNLVGLNKEFNVQAGQREGDSESSQSFAPVAGAGGGREQ